MRAAKALVLAAEIQVEIKKVKSLRVKVSFLVKVEDTSKRSNLLGR